jgi:steroid delta-isomerase-like uncharacterized protein
MSALALLERYYAAFNAGDRPAMLACLTEDVAHDINQGERQTGKAAFTAFLAHMDRCYAEQLSDITLMEHADGLRAAAELPSMASIWPPTRACPRPVASATSCPRRLLHLARWADLAGEPLLQSARMGPAGKPLIPPSFRSLMMENDNGSDFR